eukprot:PhF_6_TR42174/c0_g1_i1/m.63769
MPPKGSVQSSNKKQPAKSATTKAVEKLQRVGRAFRVRFEQGILRKRKFTTADVRAHASRYDESVDRWCSDECQLMDLMHKQRFSEVHTTLEQFIDQNQKEFNGLVKSAEARLWGLRNLGAGMCSAGSCVAHVERALEDTFGDLIIADQQRVGTSSSTLCSNVELFDQLQIESMQQYPQECQSMRNINEMFLHVQCHVEELHLLKSAVDKKLVFPTARAEMKALETAIQTISKEIQDCERVVRNTASLPGGDASLASMKKQLNLFERAVKLSHERYPRGPDFVREALMEATKNSGGTTSASSVSMTENPFVHHVQIERRCAEELTTVIARTESLREKHYATTKSHYTVKVAESNNAIQSITDAQKAVFAKLNQLSEEVNKCVQQSAELAEKRQRAIAARKALDVAESQRRTIHDAVERESQKYRDRLIFDMENAKRCIVVGDRIVEFLASDHMEAMKVDFVTASQELTNVLAELHAGYYMSLGRMVARGGDDEEALTEWRNKMELMKVKHTLLLSSMSGGGGAVGRKGGVTESLEQLLNNFLQNPKFKHGPYGMPSMEPSKLILKRGGQNNDETKKATKQHTNKPRKEERDVVKLGMNVVIEQQQPPPGLSPHPPKRPKKADKLDEPSMSPRHVSTDWGCVPIEQVVAFIRSPHKVWEASTGDVATNIVNGNGDASKKKTSSKMEKEVTPTTSTRVNPISTIPAKSQS